MKLCFCGFNPADAEPNPEGRYFCPWCAREFEESDVKEAKSASAEPEPESETPSESVAEVESETPPEE